VSTVWSLTQSDQTKAQSGGTSQDIRSKSLVCLADRGAAILVAANFQKLVKVTAVTPAIRVLVLALRTSTVGLGKSMARAGRANEAENLSHTGGF